MQKTLNTRALEFRQLSKSAHAGVNSFLSYFMPQNKGVSDGPGQELEHLNTNLLHIHLQLDYSAKLNGTFLCDYMLWFMYPLKSILNIFLQRNLSPVNHNVALCLGFLQLSPVKDIQGLSTIGTNLTKKLTYLTRGSFF